VALSGAALLAPEAQATTTLQMNLDQLSARAARIFRGTVLSAKTGTVEVGGGQLPTVTYRVRVDEAFKGTFDELKAGTNVVEIRMVAASKGATTASGARRFSVFHDMPQLSAGREYVLFVTGQSGVGLSTTVGLAQGLFGIQHQGKDESVVNGVGNVGLFRGMAPSRSAAAPALVPSAGRSAMRYSDFAQAIRASVASGSGKE
jgi:hypothetical protein